jgi:hypothetical protein
MQKKFLRMFTVAAVVCVAGTVGLAGTAFAKSDTELYGPRHVQLRQGFGLTVRVGDDAGAEPASARLQLRDKHGHWHWQGPWQRLHRTDYTDEYTTFRLTGRHPGAETFRAIVTGYETTNTLAVVVR